MTTGWLSPEDCPDCGGPLLDTSTRADLLTQRDQLGGWARLDR